MIQIEKINSLPPFDWTDHSRFEMARAGQEFINQTHSMLQIGDVAVCGFIYHSFTSPPWMWFLLAKDITVRTLVDFVFLARLIPIGTLTAVKADYLMANKFAKFYNFVPISDPVDEGGVEYIFYRKDR